MMELPKDVGSDMLDMKLNERTPALAHVSRKQKVSPPLPKKQRGEARNGEIPSFGKKIPDLWTYPRYLKSEYESNFPLNHDYVRKRKNTPEN